MKEPPEDGKVESTVQKQVGGFSPEQYFEELKNAIHIFDQEGRQPENLTAEQLAEVFA